MRWKHTSFPTMTKFNRAIFTQTGQSYKVDNRYRCSRRKRSSHDIQWNTDVKMTRSILQILEEKVNSLSLPTLKTYDQNFLKDMLEIF